MAMNNQLEGDLAEVVAGFRHDPLGYTRFIYPWGEPALDNSPGPKEWQAGLLGELGQHLQNPATRFQPFLSAVSSGHGVGKSAFVSMLVKWAMSTCDECRCVVTANSEPQLRTKTWPEITKWFRLALDGHWFNVASESITIKNPKLERTWRTDRLTWSVNNPQAFAGLHNKGKRILVIFDEASEIDDVIWEVTEGTLTDENTEIIWAVFGNPTINTGRFFKCFGELKHRWKCRSLDARKIEGTNKAQLNHWVEDYGDDSDFVRVRVKGEFPRAGSNQLIGSDVVTAARKFQAIGYHSQPKVLACDVARFGDDQTVIVCRQGRLAHVTDQLRGLDNVQVARRFVERLEEEQPDLLVVDETGLGSGVVDSLRSWGYDIQAFNGSGSPTDSQAYFNRRAEVWGLMRDWLKAGAQIDDNAELARDLEGVQYMFSGKQQIQLESKKDMKKRGMASPDLADALAMTFAVKLSGKMPVNKKSVVYTYPSQSDLAWMA